MATLTSTLTVNPAFLQEIKEDNHELRELLAHARAMFNAPVGNLPRGRNVAEVLGDLRDRLAMHFALEEAYGYFDEPLNVAPRLSRRAESLRAEHASLFLEICDLAEQAASHVRELGRPKPLEHLKHIFDRFHTRLMQHEAGENELVLEAFHDDIGVGD